MQAGPGAQGGGDSGYVGIRDALRQYAPDIAQQFGDDNAALQHLILAHRQSQQNNELAQLGQQVMPHWSKFQEWARAQQAQAQAQQSPEWWSGKPKFDPNLQQQVRFNAEQGRWEAIGNAPPDSVQKWLEWQQHQRGFLNDFASDPIAALKPGLEKMIQAEAQKIVQQNLGQFQSQATMQSIENEVSDWAYQKDPRGNFIRDQRGAPVLSQYGQVFTDGLRRAGQMGVQNPQDKAAFAQVYLANYLHSQKPDPQAQAAEAQRTNDQQKQAFLDSAAQARPNGNNSPSTPSPNNAPVPQPSAGSGAGALQQMLKASFKANGHQDLSAPLNMR